MIVLRRSLCRRMALSGRMIASLCVYLVFFVGWGLKRIGICFVRHLSGEYFQLTLSTTDREFTRLCPIVSITRNTAIPSHDQQQHNRQTRPQSSSSSSISVSTSPASSFSFPFIFAFFFAFPLPLSAGLPLFFFSGNASPEADDPSPAASSAPEPEPDADADAEPTMWKSLLTCSRRRWIRRCTAILVHSARQRVRFSFFYFLFLFFSLAQIWVVEAYPVPSIRRVLRSRSFGCLGGGFR